MPRQQTRRENPMNIPSRRTVLIGCAPTQFMCIAAMAMLWRPNQALADELTRLANRRSFFALGRDEARRASRYGTPLSLLMLDLDHFKAVSDTFGHEAGDWALRCVADTLRECMRDIDSCCRLGGEEFSALLPGTTGAHAASLAERLRAAIECTACEFGDRTVSRTVSITASIGVAALCDAASSLEAILQQADAAMYEAKTRGATRSSATPSLGLAPRPARAPTRAGPPVVPAVAAPPVGGAPSRSGPPDQPGLPGPFHDHLGDRLGAPAGQAPATHGASP